MPMIMEIKKYLEQKGQEYTPFDPNRARQIFAHFKKDFLLTFKPKVIHLVGTNGKGSTGRYIALSLAKSFKILHFTSPHLFEFNERFYRNDGIISWEELQEAHMFLSQKEYMQQASYFEYATFLALFLAKDLDFLILEAGLGGEFDSTNVIDEKISVFTQIGLDHMEILGSDLFQIAQTKLRSMGQIAFLGIQNHSLVIPIAQEIAKEKNSKLYLLKECNIVPNAPLFLNQNFALAQKTLEFLGVKSCAIDELNLIGRMQKIKDSVWVDVGHNVDCALALAYELRKEKVVLVYNAFVQKDIKSVLKALKEVVLRVEILDIQNERIMPRKELEKILKELELPFVSFKGFEQGDKYLAFGSFSVVEEIMRNFI